MLRLEENGYKKEGKNLVVKCNVGIVQVKCGEVQVPRGVILLS